MGRFLGSPFRLWDCSGDQIFSHITLQIKPEEAQVLAHLQRLFSFDEITLFPQVPHTTTRIDIYLYFNFIRNELDVKLVTQWQIEMFCFHDALMRGKQCLACLTTALCKRRVLSSQVGVQCLEHQVHWGRLLKFFNTRQNVLWHR